MVPTQTRSTNNGVRFFLVLCVASAMGDVAEVAEAVEGVDARLATREDFKKLSSSSFTHAYKLEYT